MPLIHAGFISQKVNLRDYIVIERGIFLHFCKDGCTLINLLSLLCILVLLVSSSAAAGELPGWGGSAGAGGAYPVDIGNASTTLLNPAFLGFNCHTVQVEFTPAAVELVSKEANLSPIFTAFFNNNKEKAIELIKDSMEVDTLSASVRTHHDVQVALGSFGFSVGVKAFGEATMTKDILDLIVSQPEMGREYLIADSRLDAAGYLEMGASFALPIIKQRLYAGVTGKFLWGWRYGNIEVEGELVDFEHQSPTANVISSDDGKGYAFDFGLAWKITDNFILDLSLLNLGKIYWLHPEVSDYTYSENPEGYSLDLISKEMLGESIIWNVPQTLRLGVAIQANPKVEWAGDISYVVSGPKEGETTFSLGAETTAISAMPLRVGIQYSNHTQELIFSMGLGLLLGPLSIDVGIPNVNAFSRDANSMGISVTTGLRF